MRVPKTIVLCLTALLSFSLVPAGAEEGTVRSAGSGDHGPVRQGKPDDRWAYRWGCGFTLWPGTFWPLGCCGERCDPTPDLTAPCPVEVDVHPGRADLLVDGEPVGRARDFAGNPETLWLEPGRHVLGFRCDGYMDLDVALSVRGGNTYRIREFLRRGEGVDPRSSFATVEMTGEGPVPLEINLENR